MRNFKRVRVVAVALLVSVSCAALAVAPGLISTAQRRQSPARGASGAVVYDVRSYGARGDGRTVDTPSINRAVEAAHAAGGGTVYFPAGTYLCFSIRL
ncbi:MAG TPA: glycosyl hydrolase family 28-related protein, partial [Pyrinomonadaceae bacterium]|nr:glycosyl hydrolase family 28-related protein [Pyrinomonadaceae bacterium]